MKLLSVIYWNMWRAVFWWKKRTGWLDLGQRIEVTGTVVGLEAPDLDGDRNLNLRLDPGQDRWITGFGARLTSEDQAVGPSLHCEVTPWSSQQLRDSFDALHVGDRVRIGGAWGFDGVHIGYSFFPFEVLRALVRHQPNVCDGWFEIHPVDLLNKL